MKPALNSSAGRLTVFAVRQRKRLWRGGLALALAVPQNAHPHDLEQLLRLPLEHLLQLQISPRRVSHVGARHGDRREPGADRGRHAA